MDSERIERVITAVADRGRADWVMLAEVREECIDAGFADPTGAAVAVALGMHAAGTAVLGHYEHSAGFVRWTDQGAAVCFKLADAMAETHSGTDRPPQMTVMLNVLPS